ncbi:hypothetical protein [Streptomyces sp. NPDC015131]|uniref:hypothetical protein n=1 Tax=Streptomyces sp. NPDC015131 TaxID=3364941 RepID=UPI0036FFDC8D
MGAAHYGLTIQQGETFELTITYKDSNGALVNLAGYSARMQIRESVDSPTTILDANSALSQPGITWGPFNASGVIKITLAPSITSAMSFNHAVYDMLITSGSGVVTRIIEGDVGFSKAVTR